jgi:hypothetical protein
MPDRSPDPLQKIMGRCTAPAWDTLKHLSEHPVFPELIARLEKIGGQVISLDIERVARELLGDVKTSQPPVHCQAGFETPHSQHSTDAPEPT